MGEKIDQTFWEKIYYWPIGKERMMSPKGRLVSELIDIFGMVIVAALGGMFLALAVFTEDREGLFFTYSSSGERYWYMVIGAGFILFSLGAGIARRIIILPPKHLNDEG
ncbi:hypothetical protein [Actibacterium pelagium]|uniref:Uncharacterized protein n=1 Tax=Actibacterium pelagium TaxID=2029103 RepID=A0A917EHR2_9RHOB|nr:hypothetical protein [Actibacterium pelagium]GGE43666.1 hypothetical protein GCM10011517_09180 [Actibacterium pelagium]